MFEKKFLIKVPNSIKVYYHSNKNSILLSNISIFAYSFLLLLFAELVIRYTGINKILNYIFILTPLLSSVISYYFLRYKFSNESY